MELWQILKQVMEEKKYKVADVARICELPDSTVRGIITRKQKSIALDVAFRISRGLGISLETLAGETNEKKDPPTPSEDGAEEPTLEEDIQLLTDLFVARGYIKPGEDLSDRDAAVLEKLIELLDLYFQGRN